MISYFEELANSLEKAYLGESVENTFEADYARLRTMALTLNEDTENPDSALLRSAYKKIAGKQTNVKKLSPEELDALKRNGIDVWAWAGETKMVSPNNNDIIKGRRDDRYYIKRNGHYKRDLDVDKIDLADRATKMDSRDANQDIKADPMDNYQTMNRQYDANKMQEPVNKMKSALTRKKDAQAELDNVEQRYEYEVEDNALDYDSRRADADSKFEKDRRYYQQKIDNSNDKIQNILNKHKRESLEVIESFLSTLNEAEMSYEDKRDSDLIRNVQAKLKKRSNAKLSDDELDALKRHNLVPDGNWVTMSNGHALSSKLSSRANLADMADKSPERAKSNLELDAVSSDKAAHKNSKNYSSNYSWEWTRQDKERAADAARMGRDYSDMETAIGERKFYKNQIDRAQKERDDKVAELQDKRRKADDFEAKRLAKIKETNPEIIKQAQDEIDSLLRKNESLHDISDEDFLETFAIKYSSFADHCARAFGVDSIYDLTVDEIIGWLEESGYEDISNDILLNSRSLISEGIKSENARIIRTGLENNKVNNDILEGVLGQMSDGIWENSPGMEKYWYPVEIRGVDIVIDNSPVTGWNGNQSNPYYEMSDEEVKRFFANKIKRVAQEYLNDNNMNPYNGFNEDNEEICGYFHGEPTIGDACKAYKVMK